MEELDYWNEEEFKALYNQYFSMIYRISLLYLRNTEEAEDIVQEVFLKLLDKERNFNLEKRHYSPLDIRIYFTSKDGALKGVPLKDFYEEHYVDIKLKDGNYIPGTSGTSGGDNLGTNYYRHMYTVEYGEIELENIGYIVIGDLEIPIDFK